MMSSKNKNTASNDGSQKIRDRLRDQPHIERLKSKFDLSEDAADAAVLVYRLLVGLGKGLSSSQKRSFSAFALWHGSQVADDEKLLKEDLAKAVGLSSRTLSRRFREIKEDKNCAKVLDYVKDKVRKWNERRNRSLRRMM